MHKFLEYIVKHNYWIFKLYRFAGNTVLHFIGKMIRTDEKLILFLSYGGRQYSDSPRVLYEAMLKDKRFSTFNFVWAFDKPEKYRIPNAKLIKVDTWKYFYTALKAKVWITNVNIERGLRFKKDSTIYLNTWHGTGPKKSGNAVKGRSDYDFSRVDILCCDGKYIHDIFLNYFNAREESMLWCGRPREDELMSFIPQDKERIRKKLKIELDKTVILYMPTWREYGNKELNYNYWETKLGNDFIVLIRSHHFSKERKIGSHNNSFWRDVTSYPNVNELYYAADILVSDYSSAFWDFSLLSKPMFCYAYDYETYTKSTGLLIDMRNIFPNGIKKTEQELLFAIKKMNYVDESQKAKDFCNEFVNHSINATICCIDKIYEKWLQGEKNDS